MSLAGELVRELDDEALDLLAERLAPRLAAHLQPKAADGGEDRWLTTREAAEYVGLTIDAMYRHTAARTIPCHQDGPRCKVWFRRAELDLWRRGQWQRPGLRRAA